MYNVGDHVRVVRYSEKNGGNSIGYTGIVTGISEIYSNTLEYEIDGHLWQTEDELELIQSGLKINIKYFTPECHIEKIEKGDWIDLRSAVGLQYKAGEFMMIPLGVAMELPEGYEANIVPRSSTFKNFGVIQTNSVGIIDESYKGDLDLWFMPAFSLRDGEINEGDRICQFRIVKKMEEVTFKTVDSLGNTNRGGFGSTGIK